MKQVTKTEFQIQKTIEVLDKLYQEDILEYNIWAKIHNCIIDIKDTLK